MAIGGEHRGRQSGRAQAATFRDPLVVARNLQRRGRARLVRVAAARARPAAARHRVRRLTAARSPDVALPATYLI